MSGHTKGFGDTLKEKGVVIYFVYNAGMRQLTMFGTSFRAVLAQHSESLHTNLFGEVRS